MDHQEPATAVCMECGRPLVPATTATGTGQCADCLFGPDPDWRPGDDDVPPQRTGCGDAIIDGVTALPWGTPRRRERCQTCAITGQCRGCGAPIIGGYNDVSGVPWQRQLCRDCGPDPILEGDTLILTDAVTPDDAYHSRDTIL